jgi:hypothetical protein
MNERQHQLQNDLRQVHDYAVVIKVYYGRPSARSAGHQTATWLAHTHAAVVTPALSLHVQRITATRTAPELCCIKDVTKASMHQQ